MEMLLQVALVVVGAVVAWEAREALRASARLREEVQQQQLLLEQRRMRLEERRLALDEKRAASTLDPETIPADLVARRDAETEDWARDQVEQVIRQLFATHQSWDLVRTELAKLDAYAAARESGWSQSRMVS